MGNQRVIDIAKRYIDQSAGKAADAVSDAARKQWAIQGGEYVDDITTVCVVKLNEGETENRGGGGPPNRIFQSISIDLGDDR